MPTFPDSEPVHETVSVLARRFPAWDVSFEPWREIFVAERRRGTELRLLGLASPSDLALKIGQVEAAEAEAARGASASGPDGRQS